MGILKELNQIAAKLTGENPKKKTTSQALDYIEKNITNGGGGSSTTIYEISYDVQSSIFSGTIDTNLTADDLINSIFKIEYDFVDEQTVHLTALCRVVKCLSPEGADEIYISFHYPNDYSIADVLYTPSTGAISSQ